MLDFNLTCNGFLFAWSPYNDKAVTEKHEPLETVFIISQYTYVVKAFAYITFLEMFKSIPKR